MSQKGSDQAIGALLCNEEMIDHSDQQHFIKQVNDYEAAQKLNSFQNSTNKLTNGRKSVNLEKMVEEEGRKKQMRSLDSSKPANGLNTSKKPKLRMFDGLAKRNHDLSGSQTGATSGSDINVGKSPSKSPRQSKPTRSGRLSSHGVRRTKFLSIWRYLTLRGIFRLLGESIGTYPIVYLLLAVLISSTSFGMLRITLRDRIRDGYTPSNAPSRYEMDVLREFWNTTGDPIMTVVLMTAKDGGSMLRDEYLDEAYRFSQYLMSNHSVTYKGEKVKYKDVCTYYCKINMPIKMFKDYVRMETELLIRGEELSSDVMLTYPVSKIHGLSVHLERNFFGIKMKDMIKKDEFVGQNLTQDKLPVNTSYAQLLSNLDFVKVILAIYRADRSTIEMEKKLSSWELSVYSFARNEYESDLMDVQVIGTEILDQEMIKDGRKLAPYFAAGFGFMMFFVTASVIAGAIIYNTFDCGKALIAVGAILCPILSITSTYGTISAFGIRTNSFMLVMPFLIMGIGVDDGFLMVHSWQRIGEYAENAVMRLGMVFEDVGPSITITSLTNFISFCIGALTPTPEIRLFCLTTAIALGLDYLYELIIFGPVLSIATRCEKKNIKKESSNEYGWRAKMQKNKKYILKLYCRLLTDRRFAIVLGVLVVIYWYFAIVGALRIETKLDTKKILPKDSPLQRPNELLGGVIWAEYHPVTVLINKPLDIRSNATMKRFWELVKEFESIPRCRGPELTMLWLRDYLYYYDHGDLFSLFNFFDLVEHKKADTETGYDYEKIEKFLASPLYEHWKTFMRVVKTKDGITVSRFWFSVAYWNTSRWETRIDLMQQWRAIADKYKDINVTVWEANGMFVDQMLSLKSVAIQNGIFTLMCMAIVCAVFIPNPCSVLTASVAIASISIGVFGFLSWWHFDLDPVTTAAVLMSIGLSVDFTAHVSYHYQLRHRKEIRNGRIVKIPMKGPQEKLEHTLESVGWPMIQAGASTIMCVLPLVFLQSYSPMVFFQTIILVVSWGLIHGLVVLPTLLAVLPDCLTDANCYRTFLSSNSQKSCRYTDTHEMDASIHENDFSD